MIYCQKTLIYCQNVLNNCQKFPTGLITSLKYALDSTLAIRISREMLHMMVPHLHELLLSRVNICEVIDHFTGLELQPLRVGVVLLLFPVQDGV